LSSLPPTRYYLIHELAAEMLAEEKQIISFLLIRYQENRPWRITSHHSEACTAPLDFRMLVFTVPGV